ncbi:MAG: FdtA/QdtA family cupin domain-containing protein [Lachnospiraceae bacterium]|nr:FdtA/QdtA family cupin domain-containing protein [Lachnospiraceae bacterium]
MNYRRISIKTRKTISDGNLCFFQEEDTCFAMKRFYYIYDVPAEVKRGGHAHKQLRQLLFVPYGKVRIELDDGFEKKLKY